MLWTNRPFLCPSCQARKLVAVCNYRCVSVARGTLCPMTAINALGATAAKQPRWPRLYVSIAELACTLSSSPVTFPSLHFLYLIWLAHPPSGSSLRGVGRQPRFFFFLLFHSSVMSWEIRAGYCSPWPLMRVVWRLGREVGHLIEIVSRMCGGQTRLCSPTLAFVRNIAGKKKNWCHVLNMF